MHDDGLTITPFVQAYGKTPALSESRSGCGQGFSYFKRCWAHNKIAKLYGLGLSQNLGGQDGVILAFKYLYLPDEFSGTMDFQFLI